MFGIRENVTQPVKAKSLAFLQGWYYIQWVADILLFCRNISRSALV